ncbi:MAG: hypothetical protein HUJ25_02860 [Crocinitomicaceae bacterium]|nr:hypothetical protein [Crocinitomicaceae bacterium]
MKRLIYISFIFAFILAFASCEKEVIKPNYMDNDGTRNEITDNGDFLDPSGTRGGEDGGKDDLITDPDEDEDFDEDEDGDDNIVDPDEDEDFEEKEKGKN